MVVLLRECLVAECSKQILVLKNIKINPYQPKVDMGFLLELTLHYFLKKERGTMKFIARVYCF
jgi:hypothetical protein